MMKAALFLCARCMFATWGMNSPSGDEVPLIQSQAEGWGTEWACSPCPGTQASLGVWQAPPGKISTTLELVEGDHCNVS